MKKLEDLERMESTYKGVIEHTRHMLKAYLEMSHVYKGRLRGHDLTGSG